MGYLEKHNLKMIQMSDFEYRISGSYVITQPKIKVVVVDGEEYERQDGMEHITYDLEDSWNNDRYEWEAYDFSYLSVFGCNDIKIWEKRNFLLGYTLLDFYIVHYEDICQTCSPSLNAIIYLIKNGLLGGVIIAAGRGASSRFRPNPIYEFDYYNEDLSRTISINAIKLPLCGNHFTNDIIVPFQDFLNLNFIELSKINTIKRWLEGSIERKFLPENILKHGVLTDEQKYEITKREFEKMINREEDRYNDSKIRVTRC